MDILTPIPTPVSTPSPTPNPIPEAPKKGRGRPRLYSDEERKERKRALQRRIREAKKEKVKEYQNTVSQEQKDIIGLLSTIVYDEDKVGQIKEILGEVPKKKVGRPPKKER